MAPTPWQAHRLPETPPLRGTLTLPRSDAASPRLITRRETAPDKVYANGAGDENRTRMTSLEDENRHALARQFPYMRRKRLTMINRE